MDVSMPEMNGIDAMRNIRSAAPKMRFVVLSLHYSEELVAEALRLGARGYLLKSEGSTELLACLRAVILNRSFFSASVSEIVLGRFQNSGGAVEQFPPRHRLSPREREIVQPIAEGHSSKEVAARLNISVKTVEAHRAHIMQKLQIQSLSELVRYAVRNRIVEC
jgi:DNA-binding NarL/FixJ family response regulator